MSMTMGIVVLFVKMLAVLAVLLGMAAYMVLLERKLLGWFQLRPGPNRVGPFGLLQPIADGVKMLLKEDIIPRNAERLLFLIAPALLALTSLLAFSVIPFGPDIVIDGQAVPQVISDLNVGLLMVMALSTIGVYGVALGGWASNSKFSLLGAIRGAAMMISYELPLSLALVPVVMMAGSFSLTDIVSAQKDYPFILVQPLAFALFFVSAMAESKRVPFDMPEAENELMAGFHTEYSGMRFALFFVGEYVSMVLLGALVAVFFLGGWHGPFLPPIVWFLIKIMITPFFLIWTRASLPRLRYDQLMHLCWKVLTPLALINIIVTGAFMAG